MKYEGGMDYSKIYNQEYYEEDSDRRKKASGRILSFLFENFEPSSVIDFGCGSGEWLASAKDLGVERLVGVDGKWVKKDMLIADGIELVHHNLNLEIDIGEKFDLAICVEVAEHLRPERAAGFVRDICKHSNVVLFGAAVPGQGGAVHQNEQWQSFWIDKFKGLGYLCKDIVRLEFWDKKGINTPYKQNLFLFLSKGQEDIFKDKDEVPSSMKDIIHPNLYKRKV